MGEPKKWSFRPRLSFITAHYLYIVSIIILGSVIIYPMKNMAYIDALVFASGSATQSGINTVDVNTIKLYQQIVMYIVPLITTPIFINTFVVFVRLYWFEKRFENIVALSRQPSRAKTGRSTGTLFSPTEDVDREERGVRGREIKVLHSESRAPSPDKPTPGVEAERTSTETTQVTPEFPTLAPEGFSPMDSRGSFMGQQGRDRTPSRGSSSTEGPQRNQENGNIQFVNLPSPQPRTNDPGSLSAPHIAFAENRRAPSSGKALRIPGPREFEQGDRAHEVDEDDDANTLHRARTTGDTDYGRSGAYDVPASRTISLGNAATNGSNNMRMRRVSTTVDRFLPRASTVERVMTSAFAMGPHPRKRNMSPLSRFSRKAAKEPPVMPYLSYQPTLGRNSNFVDLTDEQRDELGGIEYRSLKLLARVLVGYYVFFHLFGVVCFIPWINTMTRYKDYVKSVGVNPTWWAIYTSQTAFNDLGFTLTPDSMVSFQQATFILIVMSFLIVIGNTGFPCLLRLIIWLGFKVCPEGSSYRECLNFLLDHPRRCFTLLFPSGTTWMLFWMLVFLNVSDVILFIVLDLKDKDVTDIPVGSRIMGAIFQAASTRTSGTSVVNLAELHPAIQVSYMVMMYISVFPIAISVRKTNVYEESSLGIYANGDEEDEAANGKTSFVGAHLRKQLSFDLWYIFLGLFIITIAEGSHIENNSDYAFTTFAILFEVVSAYGTVGLSLGYPGFNTAFTGQFSVVSKLVIVAMQIRGRHRGLPYELDRAILLPSESLHKNEAADAQKRALRRRGSSFSQVGRPMTGNRSFMSQAIADD
ncbi:uncharacterized protein LAJ45_09136 [Morchella importuna]|uniref:uncharacterized protein n=1 Tax=Morchella importuna TaxID=1174673 RepID=UPI001E8D3665|nr:uncharacterized protein LAJ45_09136 [Morchella importuna]KAH8146762.1 hypothetical protein LAJ45_09136 [Morchella importuna]